MAVPYISIEHELRSSSSGSENDDDSDGEETFEQVVERGEDIQPYMFEPEAEDSDSQSDGDEGDVDPDGDGRLQNLDWCVESFRVTKLL